ncbi:MAG: glycosyltransferase [candidate division KSB1 bacterium]|nr:glycosyltransferase [candidate division KSB1 bacterium]
MPELVDIILCTFNRAHLIMRAVSSVQAQSYSHWRLLVVDDGSTDTTASLIKELQAQDSRVEYLWLPHGGLARARNAGIAHSSAPFITFIDADDEYTPEHVAVRVAYFGEHPEIDLVHGGVELVGDEQDHYVVDARDPTRLIHLRDCCIGATLFGRRAVFEKLGGFRLLPYSSESDFLARAQRQFRVQKVEWPTYRYHLEPDDRTCKRIRHAKTAEQYEEKGEV